ncbi:hypothetical protein [Bacillus pseudomycoides]|uniref:Uncharacterized protein n=1 Tax=Bacillus pseudomycoides TaxID=64104 RepID=A0A2B6RFF2_9BACI|nr:hypothetical protein [Bacillus pseudomycoides]PED69391.1 hypothetical protein CON97_25470 [Bacillus pseudomycoides]PEJ70564.1 hypothetical protein CN680_24070 [Bacillus pseudomycoides]PEM08335.1 hypothetical protein CN628_24775 [Bacillus pseudomycoides]PEM66400.1 hypothetical protein CN613_22790 [Bacillus pseudomycoides]PEO95156.1 hypothetical protein CN550_22155 [Bacillus pseudomycoides]
MAIVDIKKFVALIMQGNETIDQRIVMLNNQKETIKSQVDHLMSHIDMLNNKINFYKNML